MAEKNNRKWIALALAVALALVVIIVIAGRGQAPEVPIAKVSREDLASAITSNGKVEPISPFTARAQFPTFVEKVMATEGQSVHRGEVVLVLGDADTKSQLAQARTDLLAAQTALQNARAGGPPNEVAQLAGDLQKAQSQVANLERTQKALTELVAKQAATQDELAQNATALAQARANLQSLEQRTQALKQQAGVDAQTASLRVKQDQDLVQAFEARLRSATVTAMMDGTLYSLPVRVGDYVKVGDILAEMADLHKVRVRAFVDEPDLGGLEADEPVIITWDALPNRSWQGRTEIIPKQVVPHGTRSVGELLCAVNNDKIELLPNINVNVRINSKERLNVLAVPRGAVASEGGKRYVYVVKKNELGVGKSRLEKREIKVGIADATSYEVTGGLQEGEMVALPGDTDLRDGMTVQVVNTNAA